jgi:beta-glucosidase
MDMPGTIGFRAGGNSFFGGNITTAVNNGSLSEARLDDMIKRIMTPYFHLKQDTDFPPIDPSGAVNGTVLLKNVNGVLPLKAPKNIAVLGNDAGDVLNGEYFATTPYQQNPLGYGKLITLMIQTITDYPNRVWYTSCRWWLRYWTYVLPC